MNESYERALSQVSLLKKTLNSEKMSHQNTLQQLQTTYQIIEDIKEMLKTQQQKNKSLKKQLRQKALQLQEISKQYEDQILSIKELIERKDIQIKKYTQIKVTDYDMIRFRVITEVQAQHNEEIQQMKKEIQKKEYLFNQSLFESKVLKDKNKELQKQIEGLKDDFRHLEEELERKYTSEINKAYVSLEQEKIARKKAEKCIEREKEKSQETIKKYHQELEALQTELISRGNNKENSHRNSNLMSNNSSLLQLKESEFALENQKLKRQLKNKTQELEEVSRKHKSDQRELNKKIDEVEKQLNESRFQIRQLQAEINDSRMSSEQEAISKCKREFQKKERSLKEKYDYDLEMKEKEIRKLGKQIQSLKFAQRNEEKLGKETVNREQVLRLQRQNSQLQAELKSKVFVQRLGTKLELGQGNGERKRQQEIQNRQTRAVSVQNYKEKLDAANLQIVSLIKDKIALNEKISRLTKDK